MAGTPSHFSAFLSHKTIRRKEGAQPVNKESLDFPVRISNEVEALFLR
jgi:hypothetical protein